MGRAERIAKKARSEALSRALTPFEFVDDNVAKAIVSSKFGALTSIEELRARARTLSEAQLSAVWVAIESIDANKENAAASKASADSSSASAARSSKSSGTSIGRVRALFSKELAKRKSNMSLAPAVLECAHDFFGDDLGGPLCMVCEHETTSKVWKCRSDCGAILCGSCAFKWKHKLG